MCYSKEEYANSTDLFWVNVIKIGAKIQNNNKFPSVGYFLLCLVLMLWFVYFPTPPSWPHGKDNFYDGKNNFAKII